MARKRKPDEIKNPAKYQEHLSQKAYIPLDDYSQATLENCVPIHRAVGNWNGRDYSNLLPNTSGKPGLTKDDYDAFRPDSAKPVRYEEKMNRCDQVYKNVGLIKNIIDLMGDFTVQGIRLVHPNKRIEKFHESLWQMWNGPQVSERISNTLYRLANVPIQVYTTKLTPSEVEKLYRAEAIPNNKGIPKLPKLETRELPYKYVLLDPASVLPLGGTLSSFVTTPQYGLSLSAKVRQAILAPKSEAEKQIVANLPAEIKQAAKNNKPYPLDPNKTYVLYYKKDDWRAFADPMIYAILDDIEVLMKLKLADLSALDGATSKIRIFKLGNMEHKIAPSPAMAEKLSEILQNNVGAGVMDIVWGPDIDILETGSDSYQFLQDGKYEGTLNNIYAGMGIPPTLTGTFGAAGTTNNFISLKTLTERLEYGRGILLSFWNEQLKIVQQTMGFRFPARVLFDRMVLGDEAAEKALLIQLADRNILSDEQVQHLFDTDPELERIRVKREFQERDSGKRMPKAGQWYPDPKPELKLAQIALQTGQAAPSEVGLELKEKKTSEVSMLDKQTQLEEKKIKKMSNKPGTAVNVNLKPKGRKGQGRPKNSKDKTKRKEKTFRARSLLESWARTAQNAISDIMTPAILGIYKKKNLRQLSASQALEAEVIKFGVLANILPFSEISPTGVVSLLEKPLPIDAKALYETSLADFKNANGHEPSFDEIRNIQVSVYSTMNLEKDL